MTSTGNNKLKKNYNDWAIFSIINNVKLKEQNVVAWKFVAGKKVTADLTIKIIRKFNGEMVLSPNSNHAKKTLESIITGAEKLNLYFPSEMVLFQSDMKSYCDKGVTINIPDMIAQLDRRQFLRYKIDEHVFSKIEFMKKKNGASSIIQKFSKACFDISAGGLTFFVSKTEYPFFQKGDEISLIVLNLEKLQLKFSAEIVNIFDQDPNDRNGLYYKSWKICLKYKDIDDVTRKRIDNFVFQHLDFKEDVI